MATTKSTKFDVRGISHLALVCSDLKETDHFYQEVLGLPRVRTAELPGGGQQFFYQIADNSMISACWYPESPAHAPYVASSGWHGVSAETGNQNPPPPGVKAVSAHASLNHVAFTIPLEKQEEYKERLRAAGVPTTEVNHHILYGKDGKQAFKPEQVPPDAESIDEFVNSIYFCDPDGRKFEFAAYIRPLVPDDVKHTPARAVQVEDEVEVAARPRQTPAQRQAGA
jgi:catechol 2,3-dioxygenase-like lactoylglutathione lyase family enzyme